MTFESKSWVYYNSVNFVINSNVRNQETSKGLREQVKKKSGVAANFLSFLWLQINRGEQGLRYK